MEKSENPTTQPEQPEQQNNNPNQPETQPQKPKKTYKFIWPENWRKEISETFTIDTKIPPMPKGDDLKQRPDPREFGEKMNQIKVQISNKYNENLLSFSLGNRDTLTVCYRSPDTNPYEFTLLEYSYDLFSNPEFTINKRASHMMPKPFVNSDAVVVKKNFRTDELVVRSKDSVSVEESLILPVDE